MENKERLIVILYFLTEFAYGCKIIIINQNSPVLIQDIKKNSTRSLQKMLLGHNDSVWSLEELKNGDLASGLWDNTIRIRDSSTGTLKKTLTGHSSYVSCKMVI